MPASIERLLIDGGVGRIELALDWPVSATQGIAQGIVYVGHPHPLYGGTLDNKVVVTIARTFAGLGWLAVRLNFRGVGASVGTHDEGSGETEDFLHVIDAVPKLPTVNRRLPDAAAYCACRLFIRQFRCGKGRADIGRFKASGEIRRADRCGRRQMADAERSARNARHSWRIG